MIKALFLCLLCVALVAQGDIVVNLPEAPQVGFNHYARYVKLRHSDSKALFYWFFEAEVDAAQNPVVVWLNGGPGCSSVGEGAAQEIGPFLLKGPQFVLNIFSWNKDNYAFLVNWYSRFPNYKANELYITGESYAGHYAPQLAELILERNKGGADLSLIKLKGIMMGNIVINNSTDADGAVDYAWGHGIISDSTYRKIKKECRFAKNNQTDKCKVGIQGLMEEYSQIDIFNIYRPVCVPSNKSSPSKQVMNPGQYGLLGGQWGKPVAYNPCFDYATAYFNRRDVQLALHANVTKLSYPFSLCSAVIRKYIDSPASVLPTIQKLLDAGQRIWIFSGDIDGRVPVTSTRYSLSRMSLTVKEEWRAWFSNHQVAGWVESYEEGLTFATVRGAGHQVPVDKPEEALLLFTYFLSNNSLPASS